MQRWITRYTVPEKIHFPIKWEKVFFRYYFCKYFEIFLKLLLYIFIVDGESAGYSGEEVQNPGIFVYNLLHLLFCLFICLFVCTLMYIYVITDCLKYYCVMLK